MLHQHNQKSCFHPILEAYLHIKIRSFIFVEKVVNMRFYFLILAIVVLVAESYIFLTKNSPKPVFIAGDQNGLGVILAKKLNSLGIPIRALISKQLKNSYEGMALVHTVLGDPSNEGDVQECLNGCIGAVSFISGKSEYEGKPTLDYIGNSNVVEQVREI